MNRTKDERIFQAIAAVVMAAAVIFCAFPLILIVSGSLTSENAILDRGFTLIPSEFSLEAYHAALSNTTGVFTAFLVTICVTAVGSAVGLFVTAVTGYALSRRNFKWRNQFSFFFYFTTLFSGGIVPWYILCTKYLRLSDQYAALVLPYLLNVFYLLIMKNFMMGIPESISESARLDGAGEFRIFWSLILPLSRAAMATIGLFIAIGYWNDWYLSFLFIQDSTKYSLQYYLYKMINDAQAIQKLIGAGASISSQAVPTETLKLAMTVIATGPIVLLYPFVQKYFVQGVTIGAVKG